MEVHKIKDILLSPNFKEELLFAHFSSQLESTNLGCGGLACSSLPSSHQGTSASPEKAAEAGVEKQMQSLLFKENPITFKEE